MRTSLGLSWLGAGAKACLSAEHRSKAMLALLLLGPAAGGLQRCVRSAVQGCGVVFAYRPPVHPQHLDRNAAADARQAGHGGRSRQRRWRLSGHGAAARPADANALPTARRRAPPATAERSRSATPNATWCAASARPTASISPTMPRGDRVAVVTYLARPARRHLHLHRRPPDVDRARTRAGGAAESAKPKPKKKPAAT